MRIWQAGLERAPKVNHERGGKDALVGSCLVPLGILSAGCGFLVTVTTIHIAGSELEVWDFLGCVVGDECEDCCFTGGCGFEADFVVFGLVLSARFYLSGVCPL